MGSQGSGKGTQVSLLKSKLEEKFSEMSTLFIDTGRGFRMLASEDTFTTLRMKESLNAGDRQPDALAIYIFMSKLIYEMKENQNLIIDGSPRTVFQAEALDTVLHFYKFTKPIVIVLNVNKDEAKKRMLLRKRVDDSKESIEKRLAWYEDDVLPAIEYYRKHDYYNVIDIDGEQSVEDVHKEIIAKVGLV